MPQGPEYSDDAALVFAVALLFPYAVGAGVFIAYRVYKHFYGKPAYPKVRSQRIVPFSGYFKAVAACGGYECGGL